MGLSFIEFVELVIVFGILGIIAHRAILVFMRAKASRALMDNVVPFQNIGTDLSKTLLVLGDSTAVGVGADTPEESVAGRFAKYINATYVENLAVSGAAVEDLPKQIVQAKLSRYDYTLIQAGGNDIIMFRDARKIARVLGDALALLPTAHTTVLMCAGNVGGARLFPLPVRFFHTRINLALHKECERLAEAWGVTYVNLYEPKERDPFLKNPSIYLSEDGLHPSSEGYRLWFEKLKQAV